MEHTQPRVTCEHYFKKSRKALTKEFNCVALWLRRGTKVASLY